MSKYFITIVLIIASQISVYSQADTIKIKTSAVCKTCKKTIEESLSFEKGIKKSSLDLESKVIKVIYNPSKTNPEKIRRAVSKTGYDADSIPKDPKAFKHLPDCCKDEAGDKHGDH